MSITGTETTYRTIVLSDIHIGCPYARIDLVRSFLSENTTKRLILNGDIIDMWKIENHTGRIEKAEVLLLKDFVEISMGDTEVVYITGNHDDFLRHISPFQLGRVVLADEYELRGADQNDYLIFHGDKFDFFSSKYVWLAKAADYLYAWLLATNGVIDKTTVPAGMGHGHISKVAKRCSKKLMMFMSEFEKSVGNYARERDFDGVIVGHIHWPEIKMIDGVRYLNSGDALENNTCLVEHHSGRWEIVSLYPGE